MYTTVDNVDTDGAAMCSNVITQLSGRSTDIIQSVCTNASLQCYNSSMLVAWLDRSTTHTAPLTPLASKVAEVWPKPWLTGPNCAVYRKHSITHGASMIIIIITFA